MAGMADSRWKLWHLMAVVLASSLVFGAARALGVAFIGLLVLLVGASILVVFLPSSVLLGNWLGNRFGLALAAWGERRGGMIEHLAILAAVLAYFIILLATISCGLVLISILFVLINRLLAVMIGTD